MSPVREFEGRLKRENVAKKWSWPFDAGFQLRIDIASTA
jgi:hypothetical protein